MSISVAMKCPKLFIDEAIIKFFICSTAALLPLLLTAGIIVSGLGIADHIHRESISTPNTLPFDQIYLLCSSSLLIVSLTGCVGYSCLVAHKLREDNWERKRIILRREQQDNPSHFTRIPYSPVGIPRPTPPPLYTSRRAESYNDDSESLFHH